VRHRTGVQCNTTTRKIGGTCTIIDSKISKAHQFIFSGLCNDSIIYKGLLMPEDISRYYTDLTDDDLVTRGSAASAFSPLILFLHGVSSAFRYMCHNGEINTLRGNISRMRARKN
jgi:glutamate synthase (ferredoxin)